MTVYILTWCPSIDRLPATLLLFRTLRVGFPTAKVVVVDNCSSRDCREAIFDTAQKAGCSFIQNESPVPHFQFIGNILAVAESEVIFLDADICFWGRVENRSLTGVMAGRLIPKFQDPFTGCLTMPRLHTSFLWVDAPRLRNTLLECVDAYKFEFEPMRPVMVFENGWKRYDTGAALYGLLADKCDPFSEADLDHYDHLFCGSHLGQVMDRLQPQDAAIFADADRMVVERRALPRGLWRAQEVLFRRLGDNA